jgi:hypothetical protein
MPDYAVSLDGNTIEVCPGCGKTKHMTPDVVGRRVVCKRCGRQFRAGDRADSPPPWAAQPAAFATNGATVAPPPSVAVPPPFPVTFEPDDAIGAARRPAKSSAAGSPSTIGVVVPMLVSAIANVVMRLVRIATVCGMPIGIGMIVLCVFEFLFYAHHEELPPANFLDRAKTLGILEIVAGVFNLVSLVCGILVLIHAGKLRRAAAA